VSAETAAGFLARARDDAAAVRASLPIMDITDAIVGFHAQQAVEKSLKAVLTAGGYAFPFTHDLEGLIERCAQSSIELPTDLKDSAGLSTPYAIRHRYGGEPPTLVDRDTAPRLAEGAVAWAEQALRA
jgi:HEPN domain-containing protein